MDALLRELRTSADGIAEYHDVEVSAAALTLGSAPDRTIQLLGEAVGAEHAELTAAAGGVQVSCKRGFKVVVNGSETASARLGPGDSLDIVYGQVPSVAGTESRGVAGAKKDLPMKGPRGVDQLPRLFGNEHDGEPANTGNTYRSQGLPVARHGLRIEELERPDDRSHRVQFDLLLAQQQEFPHLLFAEILWRLPVMLGQMSNMTQIAIGRSR